MIGRRNGFKLTLGVIALFIAVGIGGNCSVSQAAALNFSGYAKEGDTLTVSGGPTGAKYNWTVTSQITGKVVKTVNAGGASLATTSGMDECMITCEVNGDATYEKAYFYCSKLPVLYITSDTPYTDYKSESKTKPYHDAAISMIGNSTYKNAEQLYNGATKIKVRGNSTASREKSPFKLKLDKKADMLGLGDGIKSKHWVLIANDIDHSLLRNKLLYDFSGDIGTEFFFRSENVTLIYNNEYEGVYQLCEHRRVDEGRIDITDWVDIGEDAAASVASYEAANNEAVWKNKGDFSDLATYDSTATDDVNKENAAAALEDVLNQVMYADYSWMDNKKVTYKNTTFDLTNSKYTDKKGKNIEIPAATGGFVAEMDFYNKDSDTVASIGTNYIQPLYFSLPEIGSDASNQAAAVTSFKKTKLYDFANRYTQSFEYALHAKDFVFRGGTLKKAKENSGGGFFGRGQRNATYNSSTGWTNSTESVTYKDAQNEGKHYSELFDMDSLVTNFIFVEYAMNWDSMKNSFFFYKDINGLAKFGPQWDFDWCWGNINMYNINTNFPTDWQTTNEWFTNEQSYQSYQWNRLLVKDPYFLTRAYEKYKKVRPVIENMIKSGGLIDRYKAALANAGQANDKRWNYTYFGGYYSGATPQNFSDSVESIRTFLKKRVAWLDKQFKDVFVLADSLGYYKAADSAKISAVQSGGTTTITAQVTDSACKSVVFQLNGVQEYTVKLTGSKASLKLSNDQIVSDGTYNVVTVYEKDKSGNYIENTSLKPSGNYEYIAKSNFVLFTKNAVVLKAGTPKVKAVSGKKAVIKWAKTSGAVKYKIYRKTGNGKYSLIKTTTKSKYTDKKVKKNKKYTYYVVAVSSNAAYNSAKSNKVTILLPGKVSGVKVVSKKKKQAILSFKRVKKASGYLVYRSVNKKKGYKKIKVLSGSKKIKFTNKKLKSKKTYYYRVVAYYKATGAVKMLAGNSNVKKVKVK